ncbi:excalibur calcium-binding domain-containing protein [Pseudonocardia endophytica]|nr:excalibur calcium-binding domain-containing protein [Pseudonocardia endophytica]
MTVLAAATIAALPLAGIASAAPAADKDCKDFSSQAAAQAALLPGDPDGLDRNKNGIACEDFDYGSGGSSGAPATSSPGSSGSASSGSSSSGSVSSSASGSASSGSASSGSGSSGGSNEPVNQVTTVPSGSVDAGDGSADGRPGDGAAAAFVLAGFGAVTASGAAVTVWRTRRPARDRG